MSSTILVKFFKAPGTLEGSDISANAYKQKCSKDNSVPRVHWLYRVSIYFSVSEILFAKYHHITWSIRYMLGLAFPVSNIPSHTHTHTHTRLTALFWDYAGEPIPER